MIRQVNNTCQFLTIMRVPRGFNYVMDFIITTNSSMEE
jgi:hypothetical protein